MMTSNQRQPVLLKDYTPPAHLIDHIELRFELDEQHTHVTARLAVRRNPASSQHVTTLQLDGGGQPLLDIRLDGEALSEQRYRLDDERLHVLDVPERFSLELRTRLEPQNNTSLEGLYRSHGTFCTQCEAEGFRKIVWFADRPDVMSRYRTTIVADPQRYPVLLSNGNRVEQGTCDDGRHFAVYDDPFPKPAYLFALVAGDLACMEDHYTTASGRKVSLQIYVEAHNRNRCGHAMTALKKAMRWDEEVYGLEYDLDNYMIVAVDDFNM
ncbi:MAG: aminopeptidase N, partial [Gammaproteobacteria bacterium]|nr:aminopeptidase N [Gammaproteobacteria bacterium]